MPNSICILIKAIHFIIKAAICATRLVKLHLSLMVTIMLCACATYKPPITGKTASIQFVGNHSYVYVDEGSSCNTRKLVDKESWSNVTVRAGERLRIEQGFDTRGSGFGNYCGLAISFIPSENFTYVAEYNLVGLRCHITIFQVTVSGEKILEPSVITEKPYNCFL